MLKSKKTRERIGVYLEAQKYMKEYVELNWESNYGKLKNLKLFFDCMVNDLQIQGSQRLLMLAEQVLTEAYSKRVKQSEFNNIMKEIDPSFKG